MFRKTILISAAAAALAFSVSAASALPFAPPRAGTAPEAASLVEPVQYRDRRHFRGRHFSDRRHFSSRHFRGDRFGGRHAFRRHHRPRTSFSFSFGAPLLRTYPTYPYYSRPYVAPGVVYGSSCAPWTPAWYDYCTAQYRTFDPETGFFFARPGQQRFCNCPY